MIEDSTIRRGSDHCVRGSRGLSLVDWVLSRPAPCAFIGHKNHDYKKCSTGTVMQKVFARSFGGSVGCAAIDSSSELAPFKCLK